MKRDEIIAALRDRLDLAGIAVKEAAADMLEADGKRLPGGNQDSEKFYRVEDADVAAKLNNEKA